MGEWSGNGVRCQRGLVKARTEASQQSLAARGKELTAGGAYIVFGDARDLREDRVQRTERLAVELDARPLDTSAT